MWLGGLAALHLGPGKIVFSAPHGQGQLPLHFTSARVDFIHGGPIWLKAQTRLWRDMLAVSFQAGPLPGLVLGKEPIPVKAQIEGPDATLKLEGKLIPPISKSRAGRPQPGNPAEAQPGPDQAARTRLGRLWKTCSPL